MKTSISKLRSSISAAQIQLRTTIQYIFVALQKQKSICKYITLWFIENARLRVLIESDTHTSVCLRFPFVIDSSCSPFMNFIYACVEYTLTIPPHLVKKRHNDHLKVDEKKYEISY